MLYDIPMAMLTLKISAFVLLTLGVVLVEGVLYFIHGHKNNKHYDNQE